MAKLENNQELEEILEKYDLDNMVGKKFYFSMNDGKTYSGTVVILGEPTANSVILKDVDILGTGVGLKYIELYLENLSARWTQDSYKKD